MGRRAPRPLRRTGRRGARLPARGTPAAAARASLPATAAGAAAGRLSGFLPRCDDRSRAAARRAHVLHEARLRNVPHPERPAARIPDAGRAAGTRSPAAVAARRAPQRTGRARPQPPAAAEVNDRHVVRQCRARSASNRDPRSADHRDLHLHNKNPSFRKEGFGKVRRYGPMACPANRRYFA